MDILELSKYNSRIAWEIIQDTDIIRIWEDIGARINLVGSLKTGLLMKHRDIDFHIYTDKLIISESFSVMRKLAEHPAIKEIQYKNLIDTEEACIEWHAWYEDKESNLWQLDLIHILTGSAWDGLVEKVTDTILEKLTPEIRQAILQIKYDIPDNEKIIGIDIYRAVFSAGVRTYKELVEWKRNSVQSEEATMQWMRSFIS